MTQLESREVQPNLSVFPQRLLEDVLLAENCLGYFSQYSQGDFQGLGAQQSVSIHLLNLLFSQTAICVLSKPTVICMGVGGRERETEGERERI